MEPGFAIVVAILISALAAPVWVPPLMIVCYGCYRLANKKKFWQFGLGFLLALIAAECAALAISGAVWRWLASASEYN